MKNHSIKTILCLGLMLLFVGTNMAATISKPTVSNTDVQKSPSNTSPNTITITKNTGTGKRVQNAKPILSQKPTVPEKPESEIPEVPPAVPDITWKENTFEIVLSYEEYSATFGLPLTEFAYNSTNKIYSYTLDEQFIFESNGIALGSLRQLSITFNLQTLKIAYTYSIQTNPLEFIPFGAFMSCHVSCSPITVPNGLYRLVKTMNSEYGLESWFDFDGQVIIRAYDYVEGDGTRSTAYFKVSSEEYAENDYVFLRGLNYVSAICGDGRTPTGGAMASGYTYNQNEDINGQMNRFWIESGKQITNGDLFCSGLSFQIAPR